MTKCKRCGRILATPEEQAKYLTDEMTKVGKLESPELRAMRYLTLLGDAVGYLHGLCFQCWPVS